MKEERFRQIFVIGGEKMTYYPKDTATKDRNLEIAKKKGYEIVEKATKLYPFNIEKNQHNFELIRNICFNRMTDMEDGEIEWDGEAYQKLADLKDEANECWDIAFMRSRENPNIAWIDGQLYHKAKKLVELAVNHREAKCIEAGRIDLLQYC